MSANNKQLIENWIEKKLQGQGNPLEDLVQGVVFFIPGSSNNPIFGQFVGIEKVRRFFQLLREKLLQERVSQTLLVTDCIAEGNQVVVLLKETFTSENKLFNPHLNHAAWFFKLNDEQKIVYLYCYDNTLVTSEVLA